MKNHGSDDQESSKDGKEKRDRDSSSKSEEEHIKKECKMKSLEEEEKANRRERERERRSRLTEEQRERIRHMRNQSRKVRLAKITEEQREKIKIQRSLSRKDRLAKLTQEQIEEMKMKRRRRYANLSTETLQKSYEQKKKKRKDIDEIWARFKQKLAVKCKVMNLSDAIENIGFRQYHKMLSTLNIEVALKFFVGFLIEVIKKWFERYDHSDFNCSDLQQYVQLCVNDVIESHMDYVVKLTCSLRQLKSIFPNSAYELQRVNPEYLNNWMYISMKINLNGFSMSRVNCSTNDFYIAKNSCGKLDDFIYCSESYQKSTNLYGKVSAESIIEYLQKIVQLISKSENDTQSERKIKVIDAILEMKSDFELCDSIIKEGYEYKVCLSKQSYVQTSDEWQPDTANAVRLYRRYQPMLSCCVKNVQAIVIKKDDSSFTENLLSRLEHSIQYRCELCDEDLGSLNFNNINDHLTEFHGRENEWSCEDCQQTFTTDYLSRRRWKHYCKNNGT